MERESTPVSGESWRVAVFSNLPGGAVYTLLDGIVRPLGHCIAGVVTSIQDATDRVIRTGVPQSRPEHAITA
ncbi:hypothetical protein BH23CHL4_BH23CHL4_18250 [soil metagenome]